VSRRAGILGAVQVLQHVPDLVRYGSKPYREPGRREQLQAALRPYAQAAAYPPHQAFIGNLKPERLWERPRPWWRDALDGAAREGPFGEILPQGEFYTMLAEVDPFHLVRMGERAREEAGELPLMDGPQVVGAVAAAHDGDDSLGAAVLLENLAAKAGGVHALRWLVRTTGVDPESIPYVIGCGEEAVGDRYQRGGGALGKAIAESAGLRDAGGSDVKAFCAGPLHALILAASLVEAGVYERVAVVAGGSLPKLGMKFAGALDHGVPILEDVLAAFAVLVGPCGDRAPVLRLEAVGRHRVSSGSSHEALLTDLVSAPLERLGRRITEVDRYATELHDPEITEPAGAGHVPERNYRMLAALAVMRGELDRGAMEGFERRHGLPGFSPTQGHVASAVPWLPHALERFRSGELRRTMLIAKGSLFIGRMTELWDGASFVLEA
jgi:betaine reductase